MPARLHARSVTPGARRSPRGVHRRPAWPWLLALIASTAAAGADPPMEEIVVKSALRDTRLADVPDSITLLQQPRIERLAVQHFEELIRVVPNMNFSGEGSRARYFQLRGIGELEQYEGAPNPAVGFIIDDIDFSGIGGSATLFDVDQVEVLRGPQGTRFGANALAGLVYMRSTDPEEQTSARIEATGGNDDTLALGAAAGGQVPGTGGSLTYRASLQQYQSNGFRTNRYNGTDDTYKRDELTSRAKFRWVPNAMWQAELTGMYLNLDNGYDAFAVDNDFDTYSDKPGDDRQQTWAGSLRVSGTLSPQVQLVSITSIALSDIDFSFDADWGNDDFWDTPQFGSSVYDYFSATDRDRDSYTQELRLASGPEGRLFGGRAEWVLGAYWQRLDENNRIANFARDDFTPPCFPPYDTLVTGPPDVCRQEFDSDYEADSLALFGRLDVGLGERTTLGLGLRTEQREAHYRDANALDFDPTDDMWGGDLTLEHRFADRLHAYARIARGYRAGGFNINPAVPAPLVQFGDESLWNYEAGLRSGSVDGRWSLDLTLFRQERNNMQVKIPLQDALGNPIAFTFVTENADAGHNAGVELEGTLAVGEQLTLRGMFGWLTTEIDDFDYDPALEGRDQAHAPHYNFSVGGLWEHPRGWFLEADVSGKDSFYFDFSHDQQSDPYAIVNLRAGRDWGSWNISAWIRNLTDKNFAVRGFYFGNEPPDFPEKLYVRLGDSRHVGLTARYSF